MQRRYIATIAGITVCVMVGVVIGPRLFALMTFPPGMDLDRDGVVTLEEWVNYHSKVPRFYGGYNAAGPIARDSHYYEHEFRRVDCNADNKMSAHEYNELHWNMRYCGSR